MAIHETFTASLANGKIEYGYTIKSDNDQDNSLFDLVLGEVDPANQYLITQAFSNNLWVAEEFCKAASSDVPVLGYQVENGAGDHWGDRPSFEILCEQVAMEDLIAAHAAGGDAWILCCVYEGDIENPTFNLGSEAENSEGANADAGR